MARKEKGLLILDRDGTIIRHIHHLCDPDQVELTPGVGNALGEIQKEGINLAIITNQSVIGRGMATRAQVDEVNERMQELLGVYGVSISMIQICPHLPTDNCDCRKPRPKMGTELLKRSGHTPNDCLMVGDQESDIEFGRNLGMETILFDTSCLGVSKATYVCQDWASIVKVVKEYMCQRN